MIKTLYAFHLQIHILLRRIKRPTSQPLLPDCQRPSYRYFDLLQTQGLTI
jgi:hypothetical protein